MNDITFVSLLPTLISVTAALALLWLTMWASSRALQWWTERRGQAAAVTAASRGVARATRLLSRATGAALLVVALLIMAHGVGVDSVPRLSWSKLSEWMRGSGLPLLFILGSALVLIRAASLVTRGLPKLLVPQSLSIAERLDRRKRIETHGRLARWGITILVLSIAAIMTLKTVGVDVTPLLAGGAIFSVALGFGAQNLVRDMIAGVFMIIEDQLRLGDIATINGKSGEVEAMHLRTTVLRGLDGTVHVIPNGQIKELSNLTKNYSFYVINLGVAYKENVDRVMDVLREIGHELCADPAYRTRILAPLEVLGVDEFAASAVVIKLRVKTIPIEKWAVGRELRRRIKNRFDAEGIELPYPHLSVHFGATSPAFKLDPAPKPGAEQEPA